MPRMACTNSKVYLFNYRNSYAGGGLAGVVDGSYLYVGGSFTSFENKPREGFLKINTSDNSLADPW